MGGGQAFQRRRHRSLNLFQDRLIIRHIGGEPIRCGIGNREGGSVKYVSAFNPLVTKYQHCIYTLIYNNVKHTETVKDLCQDTFLKVYLTVGGFRGKSSFYVWIRRIAQSVCIDYMRKQKWTEITSLDTIYERSITQTHPLPYEILQWQELRRILRQAILQFPSIRKLVFLLRYVQELSIKAIVTRLNKTESTIKAHLHKAHYQLQKLLNPYMSDEGLSE